MKCLQRLSISLSLIHDASVKDFVKLQPMLSTHKSFLNNRASFTVAIKPNYHNSTQALLVDGVLLCTQVIQNDHGCPVIS